jgi:hypothetical protein
MTVKHEEVNNRMIVGTRKALAGLAVLSMSVTGLAVGMSASSADSGPPAQITMASMWTPPSNAAHIALPSQAKPHAVPAPKPKAVAPKPKHHAHFNAGSLPARTHGWNGTGYPRAIYIALRQAGLNRTQASAVLGNVQNESVYNPETNAMDSNGLRSYGLICWNAGSYPNAYKLVTGHPYRDIRVQVRYLLHNTNNVQKVLRSGLNAHNMAGDFNQFVEVSAYSWPGGIQHEQRSINADHIYRQVR